MSNAKRTYEAMFLLEGGTTDLTVAGEPIRAVLDRNEAEVLAIKPWDDRRLTYEVKGRRRGLYVLVYFNADPSRIVEIERDCQLDERILRVLVLHREQVSQKDIDAQTPAMAAPKRDEAAGAGKTVGVEPEAAAVKEEEEEGPAELDSLSIDAELPDEVETEDLTPGQGQDLQGSL